MVHSAAAGARRVEGPGMESVHPQVPKKPQAGGGLERVQRFLTPAEGRPPRPLEEASGGGGEEESKEARGPTDHGIGGHPRRNNGVFPAKPRRAQLNVGVEERRLRGGIRRHHGAKADAPQQRGVEALKGR